MISNTITDENFYLIVASNYINPQCPTQEELDNDLARYVSINILFRRYSTSYNINIRLVLNHLIILHNVFGIQSGNIISFYKIKKEYHTQLKTFLVFLNLLDRKLLPNIKIDENLLKSIEEDII